MSEIDQVQLLRQVRLALQNRKYHTAIDYLKQAVEIAADSGDPGAEGRHLGNLALIYYRVGQPEKALDYFQKALEKAQAEGDRLTEDGLLGNMGNILRELKRYDEAITYLNKALLIANEIGDVRGRGLWLSNLGLVYDDLKKPRDAVEVHRQAVAIARQLQDQRGLASRLGNLGNSYISAGDYGHALETFEEATQVYEQLGDREGLALRLGIIGNLYSELGRTAPRDEDGTVFLNTALQYYARAFKLAQELHDRPSQAEILRGMGNACGNMGDFDQAIAHFEQAAALFLELGMHEQRVYVQHSIDLANAYRQQLKG